MSVTPLITKAESDTYNALSSDWLALTDAVKDIHIFNASVYMQNNWSCTDVEWDDTTTLDDDLKRACAYYADADRIGVLNTAVSAVAPKGMMTEETKKLGTMLKTVKWAETGNVSGNPLASIDAIMKVYCVSQTGRLVRT